LPLPGLVVGEELKQFEAVSIAPTEGSEEIRKKIVTAIRKVDGGQGSILTDMYGGTPSNISLSFLEEKKIEVITGVNLPMLLKLATTRGTWIWRRWQHLSRITAREISIWPARC